MSMVRSPKPRKSRSGRPVSPTKAILRGFCGGKGSWDDEGIVVAGRVVDTTGNVDGIVVNTEGEWEGTLLFLSAASGTGESGTMEGLLDTAGDTEGDVGGILVDTEGDVDGTLFL
mmetsp:Transcript_45722/g.89338  ORF Transcript_45722/g.89338 Transcript_45722/m.89338 type:complete len:115 (-) Transcript_45722:35-379(-)